PAPPPQRAAAAALGLQPHRRAALRPGGGGASRRYCDGVLAFRLSAFLLKGPEPLAASAGAARACAREGVRRASQSRGGARPYPDSPPRTCAAPNANFGTKIRSTSTARPTHAG